MKKTGYGLLAVVVIAAAAGFGYWKLAGNPDALRKIVLENNTRRISSGWPGRRAIS